MTRAGTSSEVARGSEGGAMVRVTRVGLFACVATSMLVLSAYIAAAKERPAPDPLVRGAEVYARQCAVCHGTAGAGDGPAAYLLAPAPRDFTSGRFRLVSTQNGVPTDEDLVATLKRGMPGSAMPPFDWMPEPDLRALAATVRELAVQGKARKLLEKARADEEELSGKEALDIAASQLAPGRPIDPGAPPPHDAV